MMVVCQRLHAQLKMDGHVMVLNLQLVLKIVVMESELAMKHVMIQI